MGTELVLVADQEATLEQWADCAAGVVGEGLVRGYIGGATHLLDTDGNGVVVFWPARHLENRREAVAMLGEGAARGSLWIDVALRFGNEDAGRAVVARVADSIGARVFDLDALTSSTADPDPAHVSDTPFEGR